MKIDSIKKEILEKIKPSKEEIKELEKQLKDFLIQVKKNIKKEKIDAQIFVGGSFAKKTLIKKDKYDADIFLRFNKKYNKDISNLTKKILSGFKFKIIHGSRDYFRIQTSTKLIFEIIPVIKINKPEESLNITDLSYSHVKYINKKIKSQKILDEIMLTKAFCQAKKCYGAESYISGFSGYSIELLTYYYGGFLNFLKNISKIKEQEIIDIEKLHKNKKRILMDLNGSKLFSPIILIDPTYKQRNALAGLSDETLKKFQKEIKIFLKNPSIDSFKPKEINLEKIKVNALKKKLNFILINIRTNKEKGDVAGTKLLKFYKHLIEEISKYFIITNKGFDYNKKQNAECFFVAKNEKEILIKGPLANDKINIKKFKKSHKKTFKKNNHIYAKEKINFDLETFLKKWKNKNKRKIKEMYISEFKIN